MIKAPVVFQAIWAVVKPFLDPVTAKKFHIFSFGSGYQDALLKAIAPDQLPVPVT